MADRLLEIDRLTKRYGDLVALQDLSFEIRAGEVFGFVGFFVASDRLRRRVM